jgi:hypothetical protein
MKAKNVISMIMLVGLVVLGVRVFGPQTPALPATPKPLTETFLASKPVVTKKGNTLHFENLHVNPTFAK